MSVSLSSIFKSLIIIGLFCLFGCSKPASPSRQELVVAAASDMVGALPELGHDFEAHSGLKVIPSFGPSGGLAQQIANGAPFDVFLSADRKFLERLVERKHIDPASRRVYAIGKLVLYAPSMQLGSLEDLRLKEVHRISIANPETAPYGRAAKQALERAGLWKDVASKIVIAENVRQALDMAETGNVDVSMTALSLVMASTPAKKLIVPGQLYDPIQQEAGIVIRSNASPNATAFLDYLGSPAGRKILQKYGFSFPNP
jgi:molybdate transport system substrate-binding protein